MDLLPLLFTIYNIEPVALGFIAVSILIGVFVAGLLYIGGQVLQHQPLIAAAKEEQGAVLITITIVILWFSILTILSKYTCLLAFNTEGCSSSYLDASMAALQVLFLKLKSIYVSLYLFEVLLGFLSTVYIPLGTFNPLAALVPISLPPLVSLSLLSNAHTVVVEAIGMTMIAIIAKQHLIDFARFGIPTLLFPLSLCLRAFPWFRATGSSLLAICVTMYFVFPLTTLLSNYLIFDLYKPTDFYNVPNVFSFCTPEKGKAQEALAQKVGEINNLKDETDKNYLQVVSSGATTDTSNLDLWSVGKSSLHAGKEGAATTYEILESMVRIMGDFSSGILSFIWGSGPKGVVGGFFFFIMEEVVKTSEIISLIVITSVFEIIITITMYRNISFFIGGELDIVGLSKLV